MESKDYFEKIMQDYNQHRNRRSLRKYCKDEAIDYDWLMEYKKTCPLRDSHSSSLPDSGFLPLSTSATSGVQTSWQVETLL